MAEFFVMNKKRRAEFKCRGNSPCAFKRKWQRFVRTENASWGEAPAIEEKVLNDWSGTT